MSPRPNLSLFGALTIALASPIAAQTPAQVDTLLAEGKTAAAFATAQGGAGAGLSNASVSPRPAISVACPPPRCVVCGDAARKPFEAKCGHPGCYSCWLELLKSGEGGAGATCPSCHKPVLKRQLTKMFFT